MKEAGKKLVEKQPFRIIMDDHNKDVPATEHTMFLDVLTFSVHSVGKNFQHIPYSLVSNYRHTHRETKSVGLINEKGDVVCQVPPSSYNRLSEPDAFRRESEGYKFGCDQDEIIIALKLTNNSGKGGTYSYVLLLKEPLTVREMQERRDASVLGVKKKREEASLSQIKMLWGA